MRNVWKIILAIAFSLILLEIMVLMKKRNVFEFTWMRIASLIGVSAVVYYYIFEYRLKKK